MEKIEILEFKRRLSLRKDEFKNDIDFVCGIFDLDGREYLKKFDWLGEEMVSVIMEIEKLKVKMSDLNYKCEKLKSDMLVENNIDLRNRVRKLSGRERILDDLYKSGFMSSDMWEVIKESFWNDRKTQNYELVKWK